MSTLEIDPAEAPPRLRRAAIVRLLRGRVRDEAAPAPAPRPGPTPANDSHPHEVPTGGAPIPAEPELTPGRIIGFVAMVLGMFMAILDIQIVAASLTQIQAGLSASQKEISWVQTSYLIAEVIMIPLAGFLSRWLGTRPTFLMSALGFVTFSFAAGLSSNLDQMIIARALQGFFGGALIPTVFATAFTAFPERHRTTTTVIISLIATLAPTAGPTIGGYLTEVASWRWLFFVNLIPGVLILIFVSRFGDFDKGDKRLGKGFDWAGLISMAAFLGCLQYFLEEGPRNDWFDDRAVLIAAIVSFCGALVFFWRTTNYFNPIVDLHPFGNINFAIGSALQFIVGTGLYGAVFLRPLFLAQVRQYSSLEIGVVMLATGLAMFLAAPIAGRLTEKIDPRLQMSGGMALAAFGFWDMGHLTSEWGFSEMFWPQIFAGAGIMSAMIPATRVTMATLSPARIKGAASLYNLVRNVGGAVALAVLTQILSDRTDFHRLRLREALVSGSAPTENFMTAVQGRMDQLGYADSSQSALALMERILNREAATMAFADGFLALAVAFAVGAGLTLLIARPKVGAVVAAPAH